MYLTNSDVLFICLLYSENVIYTCVRPFTQNTIIIRSLRNSSIPRIRYGDFIYI